MSRNSGGTYARPSNSFSNPVVGTTIDPTDADALFDDIETEMTDSLCRSGKGSMLADLSMGGFAITTATSVQFAGSSSGFTVVRPSAAASGTLTLPAATDTLIGKATTDTLTNKTFDTAGSGNSFNINGVAVTANTGTGAVARADSPNFTTSPTVTSSNASAFAVGRLGGTTPAFQVDASAATSITGLKVTSQSSGNGVNLTAQGETNVALIVNGAGSGTISLGTTSTGVINFYRNTAYQGSSSGATTIAANATASGTLTLPAATDTLVGKATTDTLTNKSISGGTNTVALSALATQSAYTFVGNNTGSSARPTEVDIAGLTTKASPAAGDYIMISDQAASGAWKKATVSSVSAAGSVSSIAGNTGAFTLGAGLTNATNEIKVDSAYLPGYVAGLTTAWASTTTFTVAAGVATDSTNATLIKLASSITKSTSAWAVGSANGGLDTGSIANSTWYHVYLIRRSDTGVVDVLFSTSASAPTMPANYDAKRRIGSVKTNGSAQFIKWFQDGSTFTWDVGTSDYGATVGSTAAQTLALNVPTGVRVQALASFGLVAAGTTSSLLVTDLSQTDTAPTGLLRTVFATNGTRTAAIVSVFTNTSAQIRFRVDQTTCDVYVFTTGWVDAL